MKSIGQRLRFEVLKRDRFTCQYCGAKAPDAVLHVDHITPRALGGEDDILNLVAACKDCNGGKSDKPLCENNAIEARRAGLEDLEQRRQQLQMLRDWHLSLVSLDAQAAQMLWDVWIGLTGVCSDITEKQTSELSQLLKKYSFDEVVEGMKSSWAKHHHNGLADAYAAIRRQCYVLKLSAADPADAKKRYTLGILRNRVSYVNLNTAANLIDLATSCGVSSEYIELSAKSCKSWTHFRSMVDEGIAVVRDQYDSLDEGNE